MRTSRDSAIGLSFQPEDAWPQSALASAASQGHPRLPTRPAHPAGRTSTGSPLLDAHSGSGSTCRTSSGSSSAQEPDEEQHHARDPTSLCSAKSWRAAVLAEFVRDQRRSLKPRPPRASTSCGAGSTDGHISAYDQRCWIGR